MLEGLKKFVNWNNGTITELYDFIDVYEERAIVDADEDIKYLVQKLFNVVFKQADLRMSQISKTYCTLALARMSSDVTRNSKDCDSESKALIQLLLGVDSYIDMLDNIIVRILVNLIIIINSYFLLKQQLQNQKVKKS